jgi:hypothetical protein
MGDTTRWAWCLFGVLDLLHAPSCYIFFVHVPLSSQIILSPTFILGAVTFVSLPSPPLAIVQPFASAAVQVISAATAKVGTMNITAPANATAFKRLRIIGVSSCDVNLVFP